MKLYNNPKHLSFTLLSVSSLFLYYPCFSQEGISAEQDTPSGFNIQCGPESGIDCFSCPIQKRENTNDGVVSRGAAIDSGGGHTRRKRYEIRDLPPDQWESFVFAMWEMKNLNMQEGVAKYGPLFKSQDYITLLHAAASQSLRGDQAHFGAHLMSFHSTFCLMVETTLLTIVEAAGKTLDGLPYWWNLDDPSKVLSPEFFGSHPGLGPEYEVTDGAFAYWNIPKMEDTYDEWVPYIVDMTETSFVGNEKGYQRSAINPLTNDFYVAYPYIDPYSGEETVYPGFDWETASLCLETPYDPSTFTIFNFTYCLDTVGDDGPFTTWHSGTHYSIGGQANEVSGRYNATTMEGTMGDFFDPATSPQGALFAPFHALLDMFLREWTSRNNDYANVTWGFPYQKSFNYFFIDDDTYDGINGNDTIASGWPIYWQDVGWAKPGSVDAMKAVTHTEAHCFLAKENVAYIYVKYSGAPDGAPGVVVPPLEAIAVEKEENSDLMTGPPTSDGAEKEDNSDIIGEPTGSPASGGGDEKITIARFLRMSTLGTLGMLLFLL